MTKTRRNGAWVKKQPVARKNEWLTKLMDDPNKGVRRELLDEFTNRQAPRLGPRRSQNERSEN